MANYNNGARLYYPLNFKGRNSSSPTPPPSGKTIVDFFSEPGVNNGSIAVKDDSSDHVNILQPPDNDPSSDYVPAQIGEQVMWVRPDTLRGSVSYLFNTTIPTPPIGSLVTKDNVGIANISTVRPPENMNYPTLRFGTHATAKNLPQWENIPTIFDVFGEPLIANGSMIYKDISESDNIEALSPPTGSITNPVIGYDHPDNKPEWIQDKFNAIPNPVSTIANPRLGFNRTTLTPEWIDAGVTPTPINQTIDSFARFTSMSISGSTGQQRYFIVGQQSSGNISSGQIKSGKITIATPTDFSSSPATSWLEIDFVVDDNNVLTLYTYKNSTSQPSKETTDGILFHSSGSTRRATITMDINNNQLRVVFTKTSTTTFTAQIRESYQYSTGNSPTPPTPTPSQTIKVGAYADYIWTMPIVTGGQEDIEFGNLASPGAISNAVPRNRLLSGHVIMTYQRINSGATLINEWVEMWYSRNTPNTGFEVIMYSYAFNASNGREWSWNEGYIKTGAVKRIKIVPNRGGLGNSAFNAHCTNLAQDTRTDAIYMSEQFTYIDNSSEETHFGGYYDRFSESINDIIDDRVSRAVAKALKEQRKELLNTYGVNCG